MLFLFPSSSDLHQTSCRTKMRNPFNTPKETSVIRDIDAVDPNDPTNAAPPEKSKWQRLWPVFACGAGLYSDGYLNGVCSLSASFENTADDGRLLAP